MDISEDPSQVSLRRNVDRRDQIHKYKFYAICLIFTPILTTFLVYIYMKLSSVQLDIMWTVIFLTFVVASPFLLSGVLVSFNKLKSVLTLARKKSQFRKKALLTSLDTCTVFKERVKEYLGEDVVRHVLTFLPRVFKGTRKKISNERIFFKPRHIAIHPEANLAVIVESGKSRLRLMRADLSDPQSDHYLRLQEHQNLPFVPEGVAISSKSNVHDPHFILQRPVQIYITDIASHRVVMCDVEGKVIWSVGRKGSIPGRFNRPGGIAYVDDGDTGAGTLYVCDTKNNRIQVLNAQNGRFMRSIGSEGHGMGRLLEPLDCDVHNKCIYVIDNLNFRVQVFSTTQGCALYSWGFRGSGSHGFWRPRSILVHQGFVYVTECDDNDLALCKVFDQNTQKHTNTWLLSEIKDPIGIASNGEYIFVIDQRGILYCYS